MRFVRIIALMQVFAAMGGCRAVGPDDPAVLAAGLTQEPSFGSNPGNLTMYSYVPASMPSSAPVVVVLHGCGQTAAEYVNAGWNEFADLAKFYVIYAETPSPGGCFGWVSATDTTRDSGQALSISRWSTT